RNWLYFLGHSMTHENVDFEECGSLKTAEDVCNMETSMRRIDEDYSNDDDDY
ncbi:9966_t:CDS:1, partial [Racocetra fulgida]